MIKIVKNILKLMQISNPKISIIMPVYNGEQYIEDSIKSILNQTLVDFELIIVNDGSTDNTKLICEQFARDDSVIAFFLHEIGKMQLFLLIFEGMGVYFKIQ